MEIVVLGITALLAGYVWQFVSGTLAKYVPSNSVTQNKFVAVAINGAFIMVTILVAHFAVRAVFGERGERA